MANTSSRMLRLLSLLQTHRYWPGAELADRLGVSPRTLRRDVDRLRELGYDVDSARGSAGGYQLRPGKALPPLLLDDDEAVAVAVGLTTTTTETVDGGGAAAVAALTKVIGLMPPALRRRLEAIRSQTEAAPRRSGPRIDTAVLTTLAQGCRDDELVRFSYTARDGQGTDRRVEPHRLVSLGQRWYLVGYDRDRQDWRSFRVDRIAAVTGGGERFRQRRLPAPSALEFVRAGQRSLPRRYDVRIRFAAPAEAVRGRVGGWGSLTPDGNGCLLEVATDWLEWPLSVVAGAGVDFEILAPAELAELVAGVAVRFARAARLP